MSWDDHVLPHGPLIELTPGLWQVTGSLKRQGLPRNMVVWRMPSGGLWLHSVVALDDTTLAELEALGRPEVMVVPSGMHRLDAPVYKNRFPALSVICPEGARAAVEKVLPVDATAEAAAELHGFRCLSGDGMKHDELCFELPLSEGGVAHVFCDALFNLEHLPGFGGWVTKMIGSSGFFGTTFIGRMLTSDKPAWKRWLLSQGKRSDVAVICVAHGNAITEDCAQNYNDAAARL